MNTQGKTEQVRCDVCRLKAEQEPQSLYDVLCWLSPPLALIEALERWQTMKQLPQPVLDYVERWRKLRTGEPMPELDGKFDAIQGTLLDVKEPVRYG
jgi:hypothetical protein